MKKHSIVISGHRTSVSLEEEFWNAFKEIAAKEAKSIAQLISDIDTSIRPMSDRRNLSSSIRLHVLKHYREKIENPPLS